MVGGRIWTFLDIFPDDGEPVVKRDANGKKIIPPVAKYVFGAATFVTVGLSVMMIPFLKESLRLNRPMQNFIAHRNLGRKYQRGQQPVLSPESSSSSLEMPSIAQALASRRMGSGGRLETSTRAGASNVDTIAADIEPDRLDEPGLSSRPLELGIGEASSTTARSDLLSTAASGSTLSSKGKERAPEVPEWPEPLMSPDDPQLVKSRWFNTLEERRLFGASPAEGEDELGKKQIKPTIYREARNDAFKALGIATGIVLGSAGVGVWIVSKILGVNSIEEFATLMRGTMKSVVPSLVERVDLERIENSEDNADASIDEWLGSIRDALREKPEETMSLREERSERTLPS